MRVLVTGSSGYIGSQVCKLLTQQGHQVIANDRRSVRHNYYHQSEINAYANIPVGVLASMDAVVHAAATSLVGPSVMNPSEYYQNNVGGTLDLLGNCVEAGVSTFVFASSAGVYGEPSEDVCHENMNAQPCSPYGWSKKMIEIVLQDYYTAYNLNSVSLRFFNVAGADSDCEMGQEPNATHIIAKAIELTMAGKDFTLFGKEFDTPDGTCVRDYVHVEDVAHGILNSIELLQTTSGAHTFNLGGERGYSNLEIVESINRVTPLTVNLKYGDPRAGDPSTLISDTDAANTILKWKPKHNLDSIISTAYKWYNK
jgi:UDP-glucose-4-epimerase GalE